MEDAALGLEQLAAATAIPSTLTALGFAREQIDAVIDKLIAAGGYNPRPLDRPGLRSLLSAACG